MPVCGNYLFFELPKKIVLNPKDGNRRFRFARLSQIFSKKNLTNRLLILYAM